MPTPITHVIFDFDGLLVDTEPCYTEANKQCLAPFGKEFTMELKAGQMGRKQTEAIPWLLEQTGLTDKITFEDYEKMYDRILVEQFAIAPACTGAERLVQHVTSLGIPTAICTGSSTLDFPLKSANHRSWLDLIPLVVLTGDDLAIKRGKPHPDGFIETMKRFSSTPASPSSVLVFEDAPNGVRAALAAGMQVVQVPTSPHPAFQMEEEVRRQITVLASLLDLDPTPFGIRAF